VEEVVKAEERPRMKDSLEMEGGEGWGDRKEEGEKEKRKKEER